MSNIDNNRAFSEGEKSGYIRKQISHLCIRFFNKRYLRVAERHCSYDPVTGKSCVNTGNESGFLTQGMILTLS